MRTTIFNFVTLFLYFNIFQKSFVSGQLSSTIKHERPTISLDSCPVDMKGINLKGEKGEEGPPGPQGPRGKDGEPGTCKCKCPLDRSPLDPGDFESARPKDPVISCKYIEDEEDETAEIEVCKEAPFTVKCEPNGPTNMFTCLSKNKKIIFNEDNRENISFTLDEKPFWLSRRSKDSDTISTASHAFNLTEFYFKYEMSQLEFLQENSVFAIQKIRYHCKNSTVTRKNTPEKDLQMLTWKEQLVGPDATNLNPFHYVIEEDGCKDSTYNWSYTDIKLVGHFGRLPILDFYIADTGSKDQRFYIELLELCFG